MQIIGNMTVKEAATYIKSELFEISDEAENEANIILSFLTDEPYSKLPFSEKQVDKNRLYPIIEKRKQRIPLQYIIGKWWFYKGEFYVGEGVLIPRQDTETLVETAVELLKNKTDITVADLCAGSGCIGISIATDYPNAKVYSVEKYDEAFHYLEKNIKHNNCRNVKAVKSDVLENSFGEYDLIVSNPPYITAEDMKSLPPEVKREPETALFGGDDGLQFYRIITNRWKKNLKKGGILAFEIGINEAVEVTKILKNEGFSEITVKKDLAGIERVVFGTANNI